MSTLRIGINGLGRIGRAAMRAAQLRASKLDWNGRVRQGPELEVVAVNDLVELDKLAYLLRYDSVHGPSPVRVETKGQHLLWNGREIAVSHERDPASIPWAQAGVDLVLECTGALGQRAVLRGHLEGARRVIVGQAAEVDQMIVIGANDHVLERKHSIFSAASCTTHAVAPLLGVLHRAFGVRWGLIGTVHAYTAGQALIDGPGAGEDLRRSRAAALNIVPTSTNATRAVLKVLPDLAGKLGGASVRVPVPDVSMFDLTVTLEGAPSLATVLDAVTQASAQPELRGVIECRDEPLVSSDLIGDPVSCVVDVGVCHGAGPLLRLCGWYDNESAYAARLLDLAALLSAN